MRKFSDEQMLQMIEDHSHWLLQDRPGWRDMRADFSDAELYRRSFKGAVLEGAIFSGSDLRYADFTGASLVNADFTRAQIDGAVFVEARLRSANLSKATAVRADFSRADLTNATVFCVNAKLAVFNDAFLDRAYIYGSRFDSANFLNAKTKNAIFNGVALDKVFNPPFIPMACPEKGSFTGWKKAISEQGDVLVSSIVELLIPEDAKRSSATGRKCRCDKAIVKSITSIDGNERFDFAGSAFDQSFVYKVGETVSVPDFENNRFIECAPGIHFFISRQEAVDY